ncbi:hypothetical protein BHU11_06725 [Tannerella sp. oral taxon 808]|nr:hypothetical protein BHU11_06725 [Tannerella sp. oral taxon 808]
MLMLELLPITIPINKANGKIIMEPEVVMVLMLGLILGAIQGMLVVWIIVIQAAVLSLKLVVVIRMMRTNISDLIQIMMLILTMELALSK